MEEIWKKKAVREKGYKTKSANVNCAYQINLGAIYRWHKDDDKHQSASLQWCISVFPTNRSLQCKFSRLFSLVRVLRTNPRESAQIYFNASDAKEKECPRKIPLGAKSEPTNHNRPMTSSDHNCERLSILTLSIAYRVFLSLLSHGQWSVSKFIIFALLRLHCDGIRTRPVLAVYHRTKHPHLVSPVMNDKVTGVSSTDMRCKVENLWESKKV